MSHRKPINLFLCQAVQSAQEVVDLGMELIDVIVRSMLSTYLDFLGKGDNIIFIQLHDPVYIYLGCAACMGIRDSIAIGIEFLCIYGGLLAQTQEQLTLHLRFRYQRFKGLPVWLANVRNECGRVSREF